MLMEYYHLPSMLQRIFPPPSLDSRKQTRRKLAAPRSANEVRQREVRVVAALEERCSRERRDGRMIVEGASREWLTEETVGSVGAAKGRVVQAEIVPLSGIVTGVWLPEAPARKTEKSLGNCRSLWWARMSLTNS